jgi:NAD(P)-dependent dehydrogenase (short-subunit alcohol dehydrogenase family)
MQAEKVALITGSSSGIGFETALLLSRSGFYTYASMRNLGKSRTITEIADKEHLPLQVVQLDGNDETSVRNAINRIETEKGRIDVLVNNAGYGFFSSIEDATLDQIKKQFETNFFGVIRLIRGVLPIMRRQRNGTIVNVSSAVGKVGLPLSSPYVATKFALEGLSESIRYELNGLGISVILIEPGIIRTNALKNAETTHRVSKSPSPYADLNERIMKVFGTLMDNSSSPRVVAEAILDAITSNDPEIRYLVGADAESIMKIRKSTSDKEFENWIYESIILEKGFIR